MIDYSHQLQFAVLQSYRSVQSIHISSIYAITIYLESFVLEHFLYGCVLVGVDQLRLIDYTERPVPCDFFVGVCQLDLLAGFGIFGNHLNGFANVVIGNYEAGIPVNAVLLSHGLMGRYASNLGKAWSCRRLSILILTRTHKHALKKEKPKSGRKTLPTCRRGIHWFLPLWAKFSDTLVMFRSQACFSFFYIEQRISAEYSTTFLFCFPLFKSLLNSSTI